MEWRCRTGTRQYPLYRLDSLMRRKTRDLLSLNRSGVSYSTVTLQHWYEQAKLNVGDYFTPLHIISVMSVIIYPSTCLTKPKLCRILSRPNIRRDVLCRGPSEPKSTIVMTYIYLLHLSWQSQKVPALQWATLEPLQFPFRSSSATPSSKCQPHVTCADRLWSQPRHPTVSHT